MSRWWPERLVVGLAPDRVDLLRLGRWPGRRVVYQTSLACTPAPGEAPWVAALRTLDAALQSATQPGPSASDGAVPSAMSVEASVTVVLSNHFMRYLVLPWQPALTRSSELAALARLRFEQIHGAVVADWTVQLGDAGYGTPLLACAVDTGLVSGVQSLMQQRGLRLTSMQGLLMAAFNRPSGVGPGRSHGKCRTTGRAGTDRAWPAVPGAAGWRAMAQREHTPHRSRRRPGDRAGACRAAGRPCWPGRDAGGERQPPAAGHRPLHAAAGFAWRNTSAG